MSQSAWMTSSGNGASRQAREIDDRFRGVEIESPREHCGAGERHALPGKQQAPRPVDRAAKRRVSCGRVATSAREQIEPPREPLEDRRRRQRARACRCQLDRERDPVQLSDDLGDRRSDVGRHLERGLHLCRARSEQLDGFALQDLVRLRVERRNGQRADRQDVLALYAEDLAARHDEGRLRRRRRPRDEDAHERIDDLLRVVEHVECPAAAGERPSDVRQRIARDELHVEHPGDRVRDPGEVACVGEIREARTALQHDRLLACEPPGESRLPRARGTEQRDDARSLLDRQLEQAVLLGPADERVGLVAEARRRAPGLRRIRRRQVRRLPRCPRLEDLDRLADATQQVLAVRIPHDVLGLDPVRSGSAEERSTGTGRAHQASRDHLRDALDLDRLRAALDVLPAVRAEDHVAHMDARARAQRDLAQKLGRQRLEPRVVGTDPAERRARILEQEEEAIGLVDLAAALLPEDLSREPIVLREELCRAQIPQRRHE